MITFYVVMYAKGFFFLYCIQWFALFLYVYDDFFLLQKGLNFIFILYEKFVRVV